MKRTTKSGLNPTVLACCLGALGCLSCGEDGGSGQPATVSLLLEAEDVVIEGLAAGDGLEDIRDGWTVEFSKYLMSIGEVELRSVGDSADHEDHSIYAVDLKRIPQGGLVLWTLEDVREGQYELYYATGEAGAERHTSLSEEDFMSLSEQGDGVWVTGALSKAGGVSCPPASLSEVGEGLETTSENGAGDPCYLNENIEFEFRAEVPAHYGPCSIDGLSAVAVASGADVSVALTIHGDHLFFNGFPEGGEGGVRRLAQWMADCDLNVDGEVTMDELSKISPADLSEFDERFQLGGAPITPLDNMVTYLKAQVMTQGHFQGEGECALDGEEHSH